MKPDVALLLITLTLAVGLSVAMWLVNVVPFNVYTSALHIVSIYIGAAGVILIQRRRK